MPQAHNAPAAAPMSPSLSSHIGLEAKPFVWMPQEPNRGILYRGICLGLRAVYWIVLLTVVTWTDLSLGKKVLAALFAATSFAIGVTFLVYSESIFAWLEPMAQAWQDRSDGWLILWFLAVITAFPPLIGYSTCVTIAGFVYGFPLGWPIVATANVVGSFLSFVAFRNFFSHWADRFVGADSRFKALTLVLKHDGLRLLVMIRLCPLPYSFSNGAISTFKSVSPVSFALATAIATPKLLIHVFIGSRLRELMRSGSNKMDAGTKAINYISIVLGMALGLYTGYWVYTKTQARAQQLEAEQGENGFSDFTPLSTHQAEAGGLQHPDAFAGEDEEGDFEWSSSSPVSGHGEAVPLRGQSNAY